jgi:hypothetical protein
MGGTNQNLSVVDSQPLPNLSVVASEPLQQQKASDPFTDEFARSYGLSGSNVSAAQMAKQTLKNIGNAAVDSYHQAQNVTGESGKSPSGSPFSLALTVPNLITNGIEGMAELLHTGVPMALSDDHETSQRGLARILAGASQVGLGMENPDGDLAGRLTQYTPKTVQDMQAGTGQSAPFNFLQGSMNRSVGAQIRDVRYGDPSKALIVEGINSPTTPGRLYGATQKLGELKPQLDNALRQSQQPVDVLGAISPIIDQATHDIANSFESDATKAAAHEDLNSLWTNALRMAPSGVTDALTANEIKQGIGDSINFSKRPTPQMPIVEAAYRQAYGAIKNGVFQASPNTEGLMGRVSNLLALKNSLVSEAEAAKAGRGGGTTLSLPQRAEAVAGRFVPGTVNAAQAVARTPVRVPVTTAAVQSPSQDPAGGQQ